jgi:RimJ/RimL family protein N-acetyltransferase
VLLGEKVLLRPRTREDVAVLHRMAAMEPSVHQIVEYGPWLPRSTESALAEYDAKLAEPPDPLNVSFTVEAQVAMGRVAHGDVVGEANLWGIDVHRRCGHIGVTLVAEARGLGFGRDVVALLCDYGFRLRGLHRLSCETLASNMPMIRAATAAGFVEEGRLRSSSWVDGAWEDDVLLSLLAAVWRNGPAKTSNIG